jgi:hypothetical protein
MHIIQSKNISCTVHFIEMYPCEYASRYEEVLLLDGADKPASRSGRFKPKIKPDYSLPTVQYEYNWRALKTFRVPRHWSAGCLATLNQIQRVYSYWGQWVEERMWSAPRHYFNICLEWRKYLGLENRDDGRRGSAALTTRQPSIRKHWH